MFSGVGPFRASLEQWDCTFRHLNSLVSDTPIALHCRERVCDFPVECQGVTGRSTSVKALKEHSRVGVNNSVRMLDHSDVIEHAFRGPALRKIVKTLPETFGAQQS